MKDPIYERPGVVTMTPVAGEHNTYMMRMADAPTQAGDPLTKATLLTDAAAALFGLANTAKPTDVFAWIGKFNRYWWRRRTTSGTAWTFVQADNSNAYPKAGTSGSYYYEYLGRPFDCLPTAPALVIGSYIGTGTSGEDNSNTLTFERAPKLLIVTEEEDTPGYRLIAVSGATVTNTNVGDNQNYGKVAVAWDGLSVSWHCTNTYAPAASQLNKSSTTYRYFAIC